MYYFKFMIIGLIVALATQFGAVFANQMRAFNRIPSPATALADAPKGSFLPEQVENVSNSDVSDAVKSLADDWNGPGMSEHIGEGFFDHQRLSQSMMTSVPRDARLKIESTRGIQTNNQFISPAANGRLQRVSTVTVTARTRIELNEAGAGFLNVPGTNEITFQVIETQN